MNSVAMFWLGVMALFLAGVGYLAVQEGREWEQFKLTHQCKVVAKRGGQLVMTTNSKGSVGTGVTSDETAYLCNDGITYWR